jgi:hypothetical protein
VSTDNKEEHDMPQAFEWLSDEMLANEKEKLALSMLAGGDMKEKTNTC